MTLTPGQQHESTVALELLDAAHGKAFIADTGYDANALIEAVRARGMKAVIIHPRPGRKWHLLKRDRKRYRLRYLVEVFFHSLKRFRAVATRYDKMACCYLGVLHVACILLCL